MSDVKVIGHKAPDTDTTLTPIVFAWYLKEHQDIDAKAYIAPGILNKETEFLLDYFDIDTPEQIDAVEEGDKLIIIDTNNPEELVKGYEEAEILEIIDHHKLVGGLSTPEPINITIRAYGCTATIVWEMIAAEVGENAPKYIYGMLAACIISDTLKLTSPTTTEADEEALEELLELAGFEMEEFAQNMFAAKSSLEGMSGKDILLADSKVFELGGKKSRVAVLETALPETALAMQAEITSAIPELKQEEGLDYVFMFVVDILNESSTLLVATEEEEEIAEKAFDKDADDGKVELPGLVSRKKQFIPMLEQALS